MNSLIKIFLCLLLCASVLPGCKGKRRTSSVRRPPSQTQQVKKQASPKQVANKGSVTKKEDLRKQRGIATIAKRRLEKYIAALSKKDKEVARLVRAQKAAILSRRAAVDEILASQSQGARAVLQGLAATTKSLATLNAHIAKTPKDKQAPFIAQRKTLNAKAKALNTQRTELLRSSPKKKQIQAIAKETRIVLKKLSKKLEAIVSASGEKGKKLIRQKNVTARQVYQLEQTLKAETAGKERGKNNKG